MSRQIRVSREAGAVLGSQLGTFLILLLFVPVPPLQKLTLALLALVGCGVGLLVYLNVGIQRRHGQRSSAAVLHRISSGDFGVSATEIEKGVGDPEIARAVRAMVVTLERTISRFTQLAQDVRSVSDGIAAATTSLATASEGQLEAAGGAGIAADRVDESIAAVRARMDQLSMRSEETSSSVIEMKASIEEVGRIATSLSSFVDETATAVTELVASLGQVASNSETVSSFAVETAATLLQMSSSTQEIERSARHSAELSQGASRAAHNGLDAVAGTVEGMRQIESSVAAAREALETLRTRSAEIGDIVRVIEEIAGQTNLLALNAAIIAAQAGSHGVGFGVVADEIRQLSTRTSKSTDEIRALIRNVQRSIDGVGTQMDGSSARVATGVELAAGAEGVLQQIIDMTGKSAAAASEIANATAEQTRGSRQATSAIEHVSEMIQQTSRATQQQSDTSRQIGEKADRVRDFADRVESAMREQQTGARAITESVEQVTDSVQHVLEAMELLARQREEIGRAISQVDTSSRESSFVVSSLAQMAGGLQQGATLLSGELGRFKLPEVRRGGSVRSATVLPTRLHLDPLYQQSMALNVVQKAIHETLVTFGEGAELIPGLAESWEVHDRGSRYVFHLRQGIRFHGGREVTAGDVKASLTRLMLPQYKAPGRWIVQNIRGAAAVSAGSSGDAEGLRVIDSRTIEITLDDAPAFFLMLLTLTQTAIIPAAEAVDPEQFRLRGTGAGPYKVREVVEGKKIVLERHSGYYEPARPRLETVELRLDISSFHEMADRFLAGELDIAHRVPLNRVAELMKDSVHQPYLIDTVSQHTSYLGFDCSTAPFNSQQVRQAVNHAIDRDRINQKLFGNLGVVAHSLLPPGLMGYDPGVRGYEHDPERARTLLRQAGFGSGFDVEYMTWPSDEFYNSGQVPMIIEDLAAAGIRVRVTHGTAEEHRNRTLKSGHGLMFARNWFADFPDPDNFFYVFFHSRSEALTGMFYRYTELDELIERGRRTVDRQQRTEIYRQLDSRILLEAPIATLFHERYFILHRPEVRGVRPYLVPPPIRFDQIWIE
jgi:methyl-accepting chemotaxis protein/ABC-type transport system substrate-binding protein